MDRVAQEAEVVVVDTAGYGLSGAGMVPHMVYFVDLAVRGRGLDPRLGALTWLLFGLGAMSGTLDRRPCR